MKLLFENWRGYLNEELNFLPIEILQGEEEFDEEEGEEGVLVQNIPFKSLSMITKQGEGVLSDIRRGELSMTDGLPVLFYNIDKKQLLVEDGNHRIFKNGWLAKKILMLMFIAERTMIPFVMFMTEKKSLIGMRNIENETKRFDKLNYYLSSEAALWIIMVGKLILN